MLGGEEGERGWVGGRKGGREGENKGKDRVRGSRCGFIISPDMDSPAVTGGSLGTE